MASGQNTKRIINGLASFLIVAAIVALFFAYRRHDVLLRGPQIHVNARPLPYYAFCSFSRMSAAYALSLIFSLLYGIAAGRSTACVLLAIPAIDVAQPSPLDCFFPAAAYF